MKIKILLVDDERELLKIMSKVLMKKGYEVECAENGNDALKMLENNNFSIVLTDLMMPGMSGLDLLEIINNKYPNIDVIVASAYGDIETAVTAVDKGAFWYLAKPFSNNELVLLIKKSLERKKLLVSNKKLESKLKDYNCYGQIIGKSPKMQEIYSHIEAVAPTDSTVLIEGESGTGKELIAKTIHEHSKRAKNDLIIVNCGSISENLLESELFGYLKGSFTGADSNKIGLFDAADNGTIFLDEISETSPALQVKLLRAVQYKEITPVGATKPHQVDVRIIAATNRELVKEVEKETFRKDLYYRLNIVNIKLPPLRDRNEDIPLLAKHFMKIISGRMNRKPLKFDEHSLQLLSEYSWPGNIRELENIIERALILSTTDRLDTELLLKILPSHNNPIPLRAPKDYEELKKNKKEIFKNLEMKFVDSALNKTSGNVSKAARLVKMDRGNFQKLINKLKIDPKKYRDD